MKNNQKTILIKGSIEEFDMNDYRFSIYNLRSSDKIDNTVFSFAKAKAFFELLKKVYNEKKDMIDLICNSFLKFHDIININVNNMNSLTNGELVTEVDVKRAYLNIFKKMFFNELDSEDKILVDSMKFYSKKCTNVPVGMCASEEIRKEFGFLLDEVENSKTNELENMFHLISKMTSFTIMSSIKNYPNNFLLNWIDNLLFKHDENVLESVLNHFKDLGFDTKVETFEVVHNSTYFIVVKNENDIKRFCKNIEYADF